MKITSFGLSTCVRSRLQRCHRKTRNLLSNLRLLVTATRNLPLFLKVHETFFFLYCVCKTKRFVCRLQRRFPLRLVLLVRAGPPRISLTVVVFSCLSRTACQHSCAHLAFTARAPALPRIQEFDVGSIYHVRLTPAHRSMAVLYLACCSSDAMQKVFTATAWLHLQLRVRHSGGQDLHQ